jgi:mRNA-degrading endonuclease RelE of RelBE toxin-antitoxin system
MPVSSGRVAELAQENGGLPERVGRHPAPARDRLAQFGRPGRRGTPSELVGLRRSPASATPQIAGKPLLDPYAGEWSAGRGTYRIGYRFDDKTVTVLHIRPWEGTDPGHFRSWNRIGSPAYREAELSALGAPWSMTTTLRGPGISAPMTSRGVCALPGTSTSETLSWTRANPSDLAPDQNLPGTS